MSDDERHDHPVVRWSRTASDPAIGYERVSLVPLWFQIATALRGAIDAGNYTTGQRLDSQRVLCDRFAVSPPTVRQAVRHLVEEGYLTPEPYSRGFLVLRRRREDRRLAS